MFKCSFPQLKTAPVKKASSVNRQHMFRSSCEGPSFRWPQLKDADGINTMVIRLRANPNGVKSGTLTELIEGYRFVEPVGLHYKIRKYQEIWVQQQFWRSCLHLASYKAGLSVLTCLVNQKRVQWSDLSVPFQFVCWEIQIQVSFFQSLVSNLVYIIYHKSLPKKHLLNLFLSSKSSSSSWSFAVCPLLLDHLLVAASERALKVSSLNGVSHFGFIDGGKRNVFFPHYHIKYSFIVCCITYLLNYNCHLKHMQKSHE